MSSIMRELVRIKKAIGLSLFYCYLAVQSIAFRAISFHTACLKHQLKYSHMYRGWAVKCLACTFGLWRWCQKMIELQITHLLGVIIRDITEVTRYSINRNDARRRRTPINDGSGVCQRRHWSSDRLSPIVFTVGLKYQNGREGDETQGID